MECKEIFNIQMVAVETISRDFYWSSHSIDLDLFSKFLLKAFLPSNDGIDNVCLNALQPRCVSDLFYQNHQNTQDSRGEISDAHLHIFLKRLSRKYKCSHQIRYRGYFWEAHGHPDPSLALFVYEDREQSSPQGKMLQKKIHHYHKHKAISHFLKTTSVWLLFG